MNRKENPVFGKIFASMYEGSLVGKGALKFAVMGYAIAKAYPVKDRMQVTLNPKLISVSLGESVSDVNEAIEFLCSPDKDSTSPDEDGRRLVKVGAFEYWLVNGMKYRSIRSEENRREQLRDAQARFRAKRRTKPMPGEISSEKLRKQGATQEELDNHATQIVEEQQEDRWP